MFLLSIFIQQAFKLFILKIWKCFYRGKQCNNMKKRKSKIFNSVNIVLIALLFVELIFVVDSEITGNPIKSVIKKAVAVESSVGKTNIAKTASCVPSKEICDKKDNDCDKLVDEGGVCKTTSTTTTATQNNLGQWLIIFTNQGTQIPLDITNFVCNNETSLIDSWIANEANKYNVEKPFQDVTCYSNQILLTGDYLSGEDFSCEGLVITIPLNTSKVIELLESSIPSVNNAKFITILHYIPFNIPVCSFTIGNKYDFVFVKNTSAGPYPPLIGSTYAKTLTHEFMHKLKATDKYDGASRACLINPLTGQEYDGYDIMCGRIPSGSGTFFSVPFNQLNVSFSTAMEINWTNNLCKDSDNGQNIYTKGTATATNSSGTFSFTDYCVSSTYVKEYYCQNNQALSANLYCSKGCLSYNGACTRPTSTGCYADPKTKKKVCPAQLT